jgi:hypothetical protein
MGSHGAIYHFTVIKTLAYSMDVSENFHCAKKRCRYDTLWSQFSYFIGNLSPTGCNPNCPNLARSTKPDE